MTTVQVETTNVPPGGYPPPQPGNPQPGYPPQQPVNPQQGYPPPSGYPQAGYPPQQQPVTFIQVPNQGPQTTAAVPSRYNRKAGLVTGILQVCAAGIIVLCGIIAISLGSPFAKIGWNFWGSIGFYLVAGILGIVSRNQSKCVIVAYMVMSIIAAVCAGGEMIFDSIAAGESRWYYLCYDDYYHHYWSATCPRKKAIQAMHALSALTALGEMIVAIVAAAYCCAGCCRSSNTPAQTTVVTYAQPSHQVTVVAPGSYPPQTTYPQIQSTSYPQPPAQPPAYVQQQQQPQPLPYQPTAHEEPK